MHKPEGLIGCCTSERRTYRNGSSRLFETRILLHFKSCLLIAAIEPQNWADDKQNLPLAYVPVSAKVLLLGGLPMCSLRPFAAQIIGESFPTNSLHIPDVTHLTF